MCPCPGLRTCRRARPPGAPHSAGLQSGPRQQGHPCPPHPSLSGRSQVLRPPVSHIQALFSFPAPSTRPLTLSPLPVSLRTPGVAALGSPALSLRGQSGLTRLLACLPPGEKPKLLQVHGALRDLIPGDPRFWHLVLRDVVTSLPSRSLDLPSLERPFPLPAPAGPPLPAASFRKPS